MLEGDMRLRCDKKGSRRVPRWFSTSFKKDGFMTAKDCNKLPSQKLLIKKCHLCGKIIESQVEVKKCPSCHKSFLPLNYFSKIKGTSVAEYHDLFAPCDELSEEDLIKGIYVLW